MLEQGELPREAHERLPRLGGTDRLLAHDQYAAEFLLERLDALADGARRHGQALGRRVEGSRVDDRGEGFEVVPLELHH